MFRVRLRFSDFYLNIEYASNSSIIFSRNCKFHVISHDIRKCVKYSNCSITVDKRFCLQRLNKILKIMSMSVSLVTNFEIICNARRLQLHFHTYVIVEYERNTSWFINCTRDRKMQIYSHGSVWYIMKLCYDCTNERERFNWSEVTCRYSYNGLDEAEIGIFAVETSHKSGLNFLNYLKNYHSTMFFSFLANYTPRGIKYWLCS